MGMTSLKMITGISLAVATQAASAQSFVTPDDYGWSRGETNSAFFHWDDFTTSSGPNAPDVASMPDPLPVGWAEPTFTETTGAGFVTSTGNIYSFGGVLEFELVVPSEPIAGGTTTVLVQTRTEGREIDPLTMDCDGTAPVETVELYREFLGPDGIGGGSRVVTLWKFEVPADGTAVVTFIADGESLSFAAVTADLLSEEADCRADVNGDGAVTPTDFSAWIAAFNAGSAACDQNGDGACSPTDFSAWIANYNNGC